MDGMEFFNIEMDQDLAAVSKTPALTRVGDDQVQQVNGKGPLCKLDKKLNSACELQKDHGFIKLCSGNPCQGT